MSRARGLHTISILRTTQIRVYLEGCFPPAPTRMDIKWIPVRRKLAIILFICLYLKEVTDAWLSHDSIDKGKGQSEHPEFETTDHATSWRKSISSGRIEETPLIIKGVRLRMLLHLCMHACTYACICKQSFQPLIKLVIV